MYKQYLKLDNSKVITTIDIPADTPIIEVTGKIYVEKDLPPENEMFFQVGPNIFIGLSGDFDDNIRHSCNPNCMLHVVGNRAIIYSIYNILSGTELTVDYSTSSTDTHDTWKMECKCGSVNCRKIISGYHYLDSSTKEMYNKKGMIPLFITHPIFMKKI